MENRAFYIESKIDRNLVLKVIPGHFVTTTSHINTYIDVKKITIPSQKARIAAKYFSDIFASMIEVDTIVCLDGTRAIGAYLAEMLASSGNAKINEGKDINIVTPETDNYGQFLFRDNVQDTIYMKKVLILIGNGSTGITADRCIDCINYYGGWVTGIGAIFSAVNMVKDLKVDAIFTKDDLQEEYHVYKHGHCPLCDSNIKIDAFVNSYGYSKI